MSKEWNYVRRLQLAQVVSYLRGVAYIIAGILTLCLVETFIMFTGLVSTQSVLYVHNLSESCFSIGRTHGSRLIHHYFG